MKLGRRDFLKVSAGTAGAMLFGSPGLGSVARAAPAESDPAMLIDVTKCIGCWWCYAACKNYNNNLPETPRPHPEDPRACW